MKKFMILFPVLFLCYCLSNAQVAINEDGTSPNASSMLDVKSTSKGLLVPRMTITERDSISNPATGLLIYCTNDNLFYSNKGSPSSPNWVMLSSQWLSKGQNIYYFHGNVGIGDSTPTHKLTIHTTNLDGNILRLIGPGDWGQGAGLYFGDSNYVSLVEDVDDKLLIYARLGTRITGGNVGIGTSNPNGNSILEISTQTKGILIPRLTNAEITALGASLGTSDTGMTVFNSQDIKQEYWDGTKWKTMVTKTSSPGSSSDGTSFCSEGVTDYDGHKYKTVKIGDQCWMAENVKSTHYADGSAITGHWAYDNDEGNAHTYGRLYTWAAVMNGESSSSSNPSGVQGICPNGWHVPSNAEWNELEMTLGMTTVEADAIDWRGSHHEGSKLKESEEAFLWIDGVFRGNNNSGFTALPGGIRDIIGDFNWLTSGAYFWSSTEYLSMTAFIRLLYLSHHNVGRFDYNKACGCSARCLQD